MNKKIWLFIVLGMLVLLPQDTKAFSPTLSTPILPYEVMTINSDITTEQVYLGELKGDPHMYEFTLGKETELVVTMVQKREGSVPLSLIVVRSNDNQRGVAEIGRLSGSGVTWQAYWDSVLGLSLSRSDTFIKKLGAGVYRVEVSSSENRGQYMLVVGTEAEDLSYFKTLGNIHLTQDFFGQSILSMLLSSYVYYPIGILVLLFLFFLTWRKKDYLQQKFAPKPRT